MNEFTQKTLIIDSEKIVCEYKLSARNAVILHGAGQAERKRYYPIAQALLKKGIGVVLFDFSGHGESSGSIKELSLERRKQQATSVIEQILGSHKPNYLIGFSMGAQTVCDLLPKYGKTSTAILLACPATYRADVQTVQFGNPIFTSKIRKSGSWKSTNATKLLANYSGKTIIAIGTDDEVIPEGVVNLLKNAAHEVIYIKYPGVSHAVSAWLGQHDSELSNLIAQLVT